MKRFLFSAMALTLLCSTSFAAPIKAMILDGQNNHDWQATTPVLKYHLEEATLFEVDVVTSPSEKESMRNFNPEFSKYDVIVLNYNGKSWNKDTQAAFLDYVSGGGSVVVVHAANNAFGRWAAYNEIIGIGGWGGRNKSSGPYHYLDDDGSRVVDADSAGPGGAHEGYAEILIENRQPDHPILKGMPQQWFQQDELYNFMRGPGKNMEILATSYSARPKDKGGSGRHEPMIMTLTYGKGTIFHTTLGHDEKSVKGKGFATIFTRGTEWAVTGNVTLPVQKGIEFPMTVTEALGQLDEESPYQAMDAILTEVGLAASTPAELAKLEAQLIGYLDNSDTSPLAVQAICNALGIAGSKAAVPSLAKLLAIDAASASAARLALEGIQGKEATQALLDELAKGQDFNEVGIINALGRRKDASAVPVLSTLAKGGITTVSAAAIQSLGKIANRDSLTALEALPESANKTAALLDCAYLMIDAEKQSDAKKIFAALLAQDDLTKHAHTAALRGMLMVDPGNGMKQIWAMLEDEATSTVGLKVLGSVPGSEQLAKDIVAHLDAVPASTQLSLMAVLGGMGHDAALPKVLELARNGRDAAIQEAAIVALGKIPGDEVSVPFLNAQATSKFGGLATQAHKSLVSTPGSTVDALVIEGISAETGAAQIEYIKVAKERNLVGATSALFGATMSSDNTVQAAAYASLGFLGGAEVSDYRTLIADTAATTGNAQDAAAYAALQVGRRMSDESARVKPVVAAMEKGDDEVRAVLMPILADIDSADSLAAVVGYAKSGSDATQNDAIDELGDWKSSSAIDAVLELAAATNNSQQRVELMDAFSGLMAKSQSVSDEKKVEQCQQAMDIGLDLAGKRVLLRALSNVKDGGALILIEELGKEPELATDAKRAALTIKQKLIEAPTLTASHNAGDLGKAIDGNAGSRWSTNGSMKPGMWFRINLNMPSDIYSITLEYSKSKNDYPRGYEVYVSNTADEQGRLVDKGVGKENSMTIEFDEPVEGRYIKIVQTGSNGLFWSIHELTVIHDPGLE